MTEPIEIRIPETRTDDWRKGQCGDCPFVNSDSDGNSCNLDLATIVPHGAWDNIIPGPRCPGEGVYSLVPVADLARMREALDLCIRQMRGTGWDSVIALAEAAKGGA